MENIKIWHTGRERPSEDGYIAFFQHDNPNLCAGRFTGGAIHLTYGYVELRTVSKWAYVSD